ncbi:single-stranded DNA-binding protein [Aeromicrobium phragmitis]|uniref:Single-stranded DNA-binding protein n=1 Tax=Aeromicrobium phragmitis TaxID=2478914 RepID=A0A3L8PJV5_9ACTN|nr:single-stranded DNA-binding protein [Aeromicrobium phragmitis]RLV55474.1 single-stranded DNA-binding protein [Aeromicrobium phragmitis]
MSEESVNAVSLAGRISAAPVTRTLPSGDEIVSFRVVVDRSRAARRRSRVRVDSFECAAWTAALRRFCSRLEVGDRVAVEGELRSRFARSGDGVVGRVTVDVSSVRREVASSP